MGLQELAKEYEEMGLDWAEDIRDDIKNSKHGKLKLLALDSLGFLAGATISGIGRLTGNPEFIAVLPVMGLFQGTLPQTSRGIKRFAKSYAKYFVGAALPYTDKIYDATVQNLPQFYETIQEVISKI